jgi:senataxin
MRVGGRGDPGVTAEAVSNASCVFATLATSGCRLVRCSPPVDVLVVDEAAQALEAEVAVTFAMRPRRALLVGDPQQLPATLLSEHAQRAGLGTSLMARLMHHCAYPFTLLDTQVRGAV